MNPILIVLPILTILMFDLGLTLRVADFAMLKRAPIAVTAGLLGQILFLPAIALLLIWTFGLSGHLALGLMLIACCPGGSSSNVFSALAGGDVALSVSLTAFSSVITLATMPLLLGSMVDLPLFNLIMQNVVLVLVPVGIGMFVAVFRPAAAAGIHSVVSRLAFPALMLLITVFFLAHRATIIANFSVVGPVVFLLLVLAMGAVALLAFVCRLDSVRRRTLVIEVGMQNSAQAIALAASPLVFADNTLAIPAIVYALLMNVVLLAYVAWFRYFMPRLTKTVA
ncbi:MAG: bile acid:sodium symporter family protein [Muribaculaceae bacterium]|nr:bile acid:sodium symporter family protein [Muribaculaceae bacterium]